MALPRIAMGAWAWGNDGTFGGKQDEGTLRDVFDTAMENGLCLWDTAYAYGAGQSEKVLGGFIRGLPRGSFMISDKLTPQMMDTSSPHPVKDMLDMQLSIMGLDRFDIYWIHNTAGAPEWTRRVAEYFEGRDDAPMIGVSNHDLSEIRQADEILQGHGLRLSAVQNHYSLINRSSEHSGILEYCRENGITFFSYMVLEQGALTGKYDSSHPMPEGSARAQTYNPLMDKLEVINAKLSEIAARHGVSTAQIPVAWAIAKGTLPIIGVTGKKQVEDAVKAANVELCDDEIAEMEETADRFGLNAIRFWEKEMRRCQAKRS
ncbi:MAG: aldo/keto reductase [Thermoplasmata archaeon]|jgi:aryl-alcohol dehydrogenase-like predicted oxidoreductase|nr:aldo/keto reductase [Thermoplasmata archaeon]